VEISRARPARVAPLPRSGRGGAERR